MKHTNNASNGNDHKKVTPSSDGDKGKKDDKKYTSYHTENEETSNPQKVRKELEPEALQERYKKGK